MGLLDRITKTNDALPAGKVIAFLNQKGGVGKTTMAFNTAHALKAQGKKVLCLDIDPQSNLSLLLGCDITDYEGPHIFNLLINSIRELKALHSPALLSEAIQESNGVDYISSHQDLAGFELSVAGISSPRQLILNRFITKNNLLNRYDHIIIDCPPTLGLLVVNVLCASDGVMVPFRPDEFSRIGLGHFYQVLEDIDDMGIVKAPKVLAHIPNLVDSRRKQEGSDLTKISDELNEEFEQANVLEPFFNKAHLVKSQAERKSVFDFKSKDFSQLQGRFTEMANIIQQNLN